MIFATMESGAVAACLLPQISHYIARSFINFAHSCFQPVFLFLSVQGAKRKLSSAQAN